MVVLNEKITLHLFINLSQIVAAVEKVQKESIIFKGKIFKSFPYYADLGIAVGKDEVQVQRLKPFKQEIPLFVHECMQHNPKHGKALSKQLAAEVNAAIVFDVNETGTKAIGTVTPIGQTSTLPQEVWVQKVMEIVQDFCQSFAQAEVQCKKNLWKAIWQRIKMVDPRVKTLVSRQVLF